MGLFLLNWICKYIIVISQNIFFLITQNLEVVALRTKHFIILYQKVSSKYSKKAIFPNISKRVGSNGLTGSKIVAETVLKT